MMTIDATQAFQDELRRFVSQTHRRLEGLRDSIIELKASDQRPGGQSPPTVEPPPAKTASGQAQDDFELKTTAEIRQTGYAPVEGKGDCEAPRPAASGVRNGLQDTTDAAERLASIKRRLAEQIEHSS